MIKNIIFDVGKVLVSYEPDAYMISLGLDEDKRERINGAMFQNELWDKSDQGLGTPEDFLREFTSNAPELAEEIRRIHTTVGNTVEMMPYACDWIRELKERGYRLYILSNYSENMINQTREKLLFLPLMDGVVFSYTIKELKPSPGIYQHLCDTYGLIPGECVFLDDREENVEGAKRMGIQGILFQSYEQGKKDLDDLLQQNEK